MAKQSQFVADMFGRRKSNSPLFFIHIPKTAGTSFREAAISHWGQPRVWSDYGNTQHTSPEVRELIHQQPDYFAFQQRLHESRIRLLSAHAPVRYFRRIFPAAQLVTLLRDPVSRTLSHYNTARTKQGFTGSLEAFCSIEEHQNVQSRYLDQLPIELVGCVGITERYMQSVAMFNRMYATRFKVMTLNQQGEHTANAQKTISAEDINIATSINQLDLQLYRSALALFETRLELEERDQNYIHAKVQKIADKRLEGWAVNMRAPEKPVVVDVYLNGSTVGSREATQYVPAMKERNAGRSGYVGFTYMFEQAPQIGDKVEVKVRDTGQVLNGSRRIKTSTALDYSNTIDTEVSTGPTLQSGAA